MSAKVPYKVRGRVMPTSASALVLDDENPRAALIEDVWQTVAIDVEVTVGGVTNHLAAWIDPDHWAEDWGDVDPDETIATAATDD